MLKLNKLHIKKNNPALTYAIVPMNNRLFKSILLKVITEGVTKSFYH